MKNLAFNTLKSGLIVGSLDIIAACIQFFCKTEKNPIVVLNFIASGVFGKDAFNGGIKMAVYGLVFHYLIAIGFTLLFFIIYPKIKRLVKNKLLLGILYGLFIWLIMQFLIVPLSQAPEIKMSFQSASISILILIVCIGIPLSWLAKG